MSTQGLTQSDPHSPKTKEKDRQMQPQNEQLKTLSQKDGNSNLTEYTFNSQNC